MSDTQTSEWIEHTGKRRPVHKDERINVQFRGGSRLDWYVVDAGVLDWVHRGNSSDIVAYRVVKP